MKIFLILATLAIITLSIRPPTPTCNPNRLPDLIPITLG